MLGFRGHFVTKSRSYSTTLGELRAAREALLDLRLVYRRRAGCSLGAVTGSREIGETIGYQLRRLRRLRGLTQEELADRANVSRDLVAKLEQGRRQTARITSLVSLACALDVELSALVQRAGDGPAIGERATTMMAASGLVKGEQGYPEIDDMNRRELLRLLAIAGASTATFGAGVDWDGLDHAVRTTCLDAATADEYGGAQRPAVAHLCRFGRWQCQSRHRTRGQCGWQRPRSAGNRADHTSRRYGGRRSR
jgi:transcriptional regulator with XRE-family HTH domain